MPEPPLRVLVLNQIAAAGLQRLPAGRYLVGAGVSAPHAILLRSADLHGREIPPSVVAVARAGAGTDNIPVDALSARGVAVFNTPGANANAVKELVLAGLLLAARRLPEALREAAFVTLHVPLVDATRHLIAADTLAQLPPGAVLLNFSRDAVVDEAAVVDALDRGSLGRYVYDFPSPALHHHPGVIALPHLGASTQEAEEHCAVMAAEQLRDFLEHGQVSNAVNFPSVAMARESRWRLAIAHANLPNMLAQISAALAAGGLNIHNMVNKSRGAMAYTLVDLDSPASAAALVGVAAVEGVRSVRDLPEGP